MEKVMEESTDKFSLICEAVKKAGEVAAPDDTLLSDAVASGASDTEHEALDDDHFRVISGIVNALNDVSNCD